jgi:hypothetical protein
VADLVVKGDLEAIRDGLKYLIDQFNGAVDFEDNSAGIWGQQDAEDAMGDFASNWTIHREEMTEGMQALEEDVKQVVAQWKDAEQKLTEAVSKKPSENRAR